MKLNFIGVAQALIAVENTEKTWTQRIWEGGQLLPLGGLVFTLIIVAADGSRRESTLEVQEEAVLWRIPALAAGDFFYELWVSDDSGSRERMFYGALEVVPSLVMQRMASSQAPVLETFVGSNGKLTWQWAAGNAAAMYAGQARIAADEAQAAEAQMQDVLAAVPELRAFIATFRSDLARAVRIVDGVWVIGDVVTEQPARGPRGMNADEVQYHVLASSADLPTDAEHCTPNHRYIVGTVQFLWVEGAWREFPLTENLPATDEAHGTVMLATDEVLQGSTALPVGNNAAGQLVADARNMPLPEATTEDAGVVRLAAAIEEGDTGVTSADKVAEALSGKQDTLDFDDPQSEINAKIAAAVAAAVEGLGVPQVGDIKINFSRTAPDGYLPMEGQRGLSRSQYAALFEYLSLNGVVAASGTPVADSGDGATTFDMPDASGCFPRFIGSGRTLDAGRVPGSFQAAAAPNITGRFICDDWMTGKTAAYWNNSTTYKPVMDAEAEHEGCFLGVVYRGLSYSPSQYRRELISGEDSERYSLMDTFPDFYKYDSSNSSGKTSSTGTDDGTNAHRMTFDASRCAQVYQDGVTEVRPANVAFYAYIKY